MIAILRNRATHAGQLERWLGGPNVEQLSTLMKNWYGPPIAVGSVPGRVFAHRGGDFQGRITEGGYLSGLEAAELVLRRIKRGYHRAVHNAARQHQLNAGFASLSDIIAEATAGKRYEFGFQKAGATGVVGVTNSLWGLGNQPAAGANAANAPGGEAPTDATTGAFPFTNPTGGDTMHFVGANIVASLANTLLLYDRIFQVNKTMNSTADESVTGVPTRYQNTTPGQPDSIGGNFLFVEVGGTALAATAHNWANCLYRDDAGNDAQALPSLTGNSGAIVRRLDHPAQQWFAPLASGDFGIADLNQIDCSAAVATGVINFVIGHPIAWLPCPLVNLLIPVDGIQSAFGLARIFDDAALAFLEVTKPATGATTYSGTLTTVFG